MSCAYLREPSFQNLLKHFYRYVGLRMVWAFMMCDHKLPGQLGNCCVDEVLSLIAGQATRASKP